MRARQYLIILGLMVFSVACAKQGSDWIVKVNKQTISKSDLETGLINLSTNLQQQIAKEKQPQYVLNQLVQNEILYQEALKKKINEEQDYTDYMTRLENQFAYQKKQALVDLFIRDSIDSGITISDEEVSQAYTSNKAALFSQYEQRAISHIVLKDKKTADSVLRSLNKNANFSSLAKTKSIDVNTAKDGGKIPGYFRKGSLNKELEGPIFKLKRIGSYTTPIKTEAGYHIFKLNERQTVPERSLDEVKDFIKNQLYVNKRNQGITNLLQTVKESYDISQNDELTEKNKKASEAQPAAQPAADASNG